MIEINRDSESIEKSPFQEEVTPENYFACANRAEVLSNMKKAVQNGVSLMVLTGEEGSGKTMMCRLLEREASCKTIFFSQTVDSFEEVVRTIALSLDLGLDDSGEMENRDVDQALEQITDFLLSESLDLLIIFDEAENIFLATLERIRKMLDRINGAGARMHILLSGRQTLLENCDQLSLGDFQNGDDLHFDLVPLTEDETGEYLQNCADRLTDIGAAKVFNEEFVDRIYTLAEGNFRKTNILGEEAVKPHCDDTSFMVLLEGVKEGVYMGHDNSIKTIYSQLLQRITAYLPWIGGAACCVLLIFFLFGPGDNENDVSKDIAKVKKVEQIQMEETTGQNANDQLSEIKELVTMAPVEELQPPEEEEIAGQVLEKSSADNTEMEKVALLPSVEPSAQQNIDRMVKEAEKIVAEKNVLPERSDAVEEMSNTVPGGAENEVVETAAKQFPLEIAAQEKADVVAIRPIVDQQKKAVSLPTEPRETGKAQPSKKVRNSIAPNVNSPADRLYNERLAAGLRWESAEKKKMHTVQLMALTSQTAEKNLKSMLMQVNYRQEAGNFYIFNKATASQSVFVFYGEYPSIERARLARDSLPQFLRDHKPYVLSIKEALGKAGK